MAALDQECTKYYTAIGSQPSRTEVLDEAQGGGLIKGFVEKVRRSSGHGNRGWLVMKQTHSDLLRDVLQDSNSDRCQTQ